MAFTCPNCAGKLYYSIKDKKLKCVNCGSFTEVEEYRLKNDAQEVTDTYGLSSFVCRNCGAEILASDDEAVSYCSYCGSEQVLEGRMTTETRPRFIIPFQKTKSQCKAAYKKATEKLAYLPGELRDPEFLDRFRGTYIPYWMYKVDFDGDSVIKATKKRRSGDSTIISHMDVGTRLSGDYDGVPYDASSCFDDTISDLIMPFKKEDLTPFTPAYMAGFYADRASVPPENYREDALVRASGAALEEMKRTFQSRKMSMEEPSPEERVEVMKPRCDNFFATLFPVWFLTWRKKGWQSRQH